MSTVLNTKIAWIFKYPEAKEPMKAMQEGDEFTCRAEPDNQYDPNAIALYLGEVKCGYIPRDIAAIMSVDNILMITKGNSFDSIAIHFKTGEVSKEVF
jgi:hypothetical protein